MNILHAWMALYTAALALAFYCLHRLKKRGDSQLDMGRLVFRLKRVEALFHERDAEGREIWLCTECAADVPPNGHTLIECEDCQEPFPDKRKP